ncbi:MAG: septum formation initiator family protein [Candidatus Omnitrophica bacterium]|nr:septum formation initiator family protein [Candidatus Omnitrophota bacterium]
MEKKKIILRFFGFLFLFIVLFLPGYSKFQELAQKNRYLEEQMRQTRISNERLKDEIKRMREDPVYVEKIARDKLRVTKKGEVIYKIVEEEKDK